MGDLESGTPALPALFYDDQTDSDGSSVGYAAEDMEGGSGGGGRRRHVMSDLPLPPAPLPPAPLPPPPPPLMNAIPSMLPTVAFGDAANALMGMARWLNGFMGDDPQSESDSLGRSSATIVNNYEDDSDTDNEDEDDDETGSPARKPSSDDEEHLQNVVAQDESVARGRRAARERRQRVRPWSTDNTAAASTICTGSIDCLDCGQCTPTAVGPANTHGATVRVAETTVSLSASGVQRAPAMAQVSLRTLLTRHYACMVGHSLDSRLTTYFASPNVKSVILQRLVVRIATRTEDDLATTTTTTPPPADVHANHVLVHQPNRVCCRQSARPGLLGRARLQVSFGGSPCTPLVNVVIQNAPDETLDYYPTASLAPVCNHAHRHTLDARAPRPGTAAAAVVVYQSPVPVALVRRLAMHHWLVGDSHCPHCRPPLEANQANLVPNPQWATGPASPIAASSDALYRRMQRREEPLVYSEQWAELPMDSLLADTVTASADAREQTYVVGSGDDDSDPRRLRVSHAAAAHGLAVLRHEVLDQVRAVDLDRQMVCLDVSTATAPDSNTHRTLIDITLQAHFVDAGADDYCNNEALVK